MVNVKAYTTVRDRRCSEGIGTRSKQFYVAFKDDGTIVSKDLYNWLESLDRVTNYVSIIVAGTNTVKTYYVPLLNEED